MLLQLPRLWDYTGGYAMLGLGDIVIPGLLLSFAHRYDLSVSHCRRCRRRIDQHLIMWLLVVGSLRLLVGVVFSNHLGGRSIPGTRPSQHHGLSARCFPWPEVAGPRLVLHPPPGPQVSQQDCLKFFVHLSFASSSGRPSPQPGLLRIHGGRLCGGPVDGQHGGLRHGYGPGTPPYAVMFGRILRGQPRRVSYQLVRSLKPLMHVLWCQGMHEHSVDF